MLTRAMSALLVIGFLSGCSVQLAPSYDKSIVDGLSKANEAALILFASVASGATADSYAAKEKEYSTVIGSFDALRLQAKARPTPQSGIMKMLGAGGEPNKNPKEIPQLEAPTPNILADTVERLTRLGDQHKKVGLTSEFVKLMKSAYEIGMDQVLTYEKALER